MNELAQQQSITSSSIQGAQKTIPDVGAEFPVAEGNTSHKNSSAKPAPPYEFHTSPGFAVVCPVDAAHAKPPKAMPQSVTAD